MKRYDYIISGAGAAGLSLLMRFMQAPFFAGKSMLVVDREQKIANDHTWCFWEQQPGLFESVIHHEWQKVHFYSGDKSLLLDLQPYSYKMIRSADFYAYVYECARSHSNIDFVYGRVEAAGNEGNKALVIVDGIRYTADYVFNSILFSPPTVPAGKYYLLQHFKGVVIETPHPVFNPSQATLMDFRVSQENGTSFVYVLPLTSNRALVEYTLFSEQLLPAIAYDTALQDYVSRILSVSTYQVIEEEFGVIPMTNLNFVKRVGRVINIGTAGGQTKASSGYTFQFIQKHSDTIVRDLINEGTVRDRSSFFDRRFSLYDSTLLNILAGKKLPGDKIFFDLFSKNPVDRVLRFLDNESTLEDEINIMATLPQGVFMRAALQELFK